MKILPLTPNFGSSIESFLRWEEDSISALGGARDFNSIWGCWQAAEGLCITAKEKRFADYDSAYKSFEQQDFEIAVRRSGGTTVPHGEGILAITHIAKTHGPKNIVNSYLNFCAHIQAVLNDLGFITEVGPATGAYCDGDYNILLDGKKLAGTSQRWTRGGPSKTQIVLNHAVMLVTADHQRATQRVNRFHQLADQHSPFDESASTSLWDARHSSSQLSATQLQKRDFFDMVVNAFTKHQTNSPKLSARGIND